MATPSSRAIEPALRAEALESLLLERGLDRHEDDRDVHPHLRDRGRPDERGEGRGARRGPTPSTSSGCSPTAPRRSPSWASRGRRASTWWWSRTPRRCTTSSSARSAPATRGRCSGCRRPGTRTRPTASRVVQGAAGGARASGAPSCAADVEVRVHDSSSEVRYLVLPERPPGTESMTRGRARRAGHARRDGRRPEGRRRRERRRPSSSTSTGRPRRRGRTASWSSRSRGRDGPSA